MTVGSGSSRRPQPPLPQPCRASCPSFQPFLFPLQSAPVAIETTGSSGLAVGHPQGLKAQPGTRGGNRKPPPPSALRRVAVGTGLGAASQLTRALPREPAARRPLWCPGPLRVTCGVATLVCQVVGGSSLISLGLPSHRWASGPLAPEASVSSNALPLQPAPRTSLCPLPSALFGGRAPWPLTSPFRGLRSGGLTPGWVIFKEAS